MSDPKEPPKDPNWQPFALDGLRDRLLEVKALLEQAALVGLSQDADKVERLTELAKKMREEAHGGKPPRRYR